MWLQQATPTHLPAASGLPACRNYIVVEDLEAFLPHAQAEEAFNMLDDNGDGRLRLHDIRDAVIKIYKERRNLAMSLKVKAMMMLSGGSSLRVLQGHMLDGHHMLHT